jgi:hypothetical protein
MRRVNSQMQPETSGVQILSMREESDSHLEETRCEERSLVQVWRLILRDNTR